MKRTSARVALALGFVIAGLPVRVSPARPFTRVDLVPAYLRFERAFATATLDEETLRTLDRRFDAFTARAFLGDFAAGHDALNAMSSWLELGRDRTAAERVADALIVDVDPPYSVRGGAPPALTLRSVVDLALEEAVELRGHLEVKKKDGALVRGPEVHLTPDDLDVVDLALEFPDAWRSLPLGDHDLRLVVDGRVTATARWSLGSAPLPEIRARLLARLDALPEPGPPTDAVAVCRNRAALLRLDPLGLETAILVEPPLALAAAVEDEVARLERGLDPYRARGDDHWRTFRVGRTDAPARVFAAPSDDPSSRPLVIALHGAGADENMFFRAYGAGRLLELARERGAVVVTPRTEALFRGDSALADLVKGIAADHAFDPRSVHLIGHSMGAMAAMRRAATDASTLTSVVCIAGAARVDGDGPVARTLVVTGSEDRIVPSAGVAELARAAADAGRPVELRIEEGRGHTLLVPLVLPEAIDWLLSYSR